MKKTGMICRGLLCALFLVMVYRSFFGFDASDESSYLAAAYSLINGSRLFIDCWDVHQTSAILLAPLVWLYTLVLGDTTGILLAFRILYCSLSFALSMLFLNVLIKGVANSVGAMFAFLSAALIQVIAPVGMPALSYNTFPVLFFLLSSIFIAPGKRGFVRGRLALNGLCFALAVQSYPFMIVAFPAVAAMVVCFDRDGERMGFLRVCLFWALGALVPLLVFLFNLAGQGSLVDSLSSVHFVFSDPEHLESGSLEKLVKYFESVAYYLGAIGIVVLVLSYGLAVLLRFGILPERIHGVALKALRLLVLAGLTYWLYAVARSGTANVIWIDLFQFGIMLFLPSLVIASARRAGWSGLLIFMGLLASFGAQVGSNVGFNLSSYFAVIGSVGACSFFANEPDCDTAKRVVGFQRIGAKICDMAIPLAVCLCLLLSLYARCNYIYRDGSLEELNARIQVGPAAGLMTTQQSKEWYDGCYDAIMQNAEGSRSLLVGVLFPTGYLMVPAEVMAPRVWRTALDAEDLRQWYEDHPGKGLPDLIFVKSGDCWGYDLFSDNISGTVVEQIINSGDYAKIETSAGTVYKNRCSGLATR